MTARKPKAPRYSLVVPLYNTPQWLLAETVGSVTSQTFTDWELVLVDDHSPVRETVDHATALAAEDARITVVALPENRGISGASNAGLEAATGEFIALLDHDDTITTDALQRFETVLAGNPEVDYAYSDQDLLSGDGSVAYGDFRKPAWSPERFLGQMYTSHLSVFRRALLAETGLFRQAFDGSQDHDLLLRISERARAVAHVPGVLYHWRAIEGSTAQDGNAKAYAWEAGRGAVAEAVRRRGLGADVVLGPSFGTFLPRRRATLERTSVVVVLDGAPDPIIATSRTWREDPPLDLIAVAAESTAPEWRDDLRAAGFTVHRVPAGSSRAALLQLGAVHANGDAIVFVSSDVQTTSDDLRQLVGPLTEDGVGLTGGRLTHEGAIAHAGFRQRTDELRDAYRSAPARHPGHYGDLTVNREVSAVSSRFAAIGRDRFFELGGFTTEADEFSADLDLALKVRSRGDRVLSLVSAVGTTSTVADSTPSAAGTDLIAARWGWPAVDPYIR
ncbi:glycosyltransferase [Plantibacter sp. YIM 135347]|uniref:glycosyltransferase n=1 Tax=Plantibacter sp. YIM 135347 TaxID=3423919 RepID=UPI003D339B44